MTAEQIKLEQKRSELRIAITNGDYSKVQPLARLIIRLSELIE